MKSSDTITPSGQHDRVIVGINCFIFKTFRSGGRHSFMDEGVVCADSILCLEYTGD